MPPHRPCGIDLRPPRRERRQARQPAAPWRAHHHRDARPHPHLHATNREAGRTARRDRARVRAAPPTGAPPCAPAPRPACRPPRHGPDPQRNFRFFDNRQKYLLFVNTCSEKWVVANRVALELANIHPRPPALRLFDAGVGDGTVLLRALRAMHDHFPHTPFYVVGKEISLEDVRLAMQKMSDRFTEHPATVLVLTNLAYADAPWLAVKSMRAASSMVWHEVALTGNSVAPVRAADHRPACRSSRENWKAGVSPKTGNPVYERPVVLVVYREDHKFLLDPIIPQPGGTRADYDLVIASQPYRARASLDFKAKRVIAPLARALGPGGRTDRHPFTRQRSRHGHHSKGLAGRQSVHPRPPPDHEGGEAGARAGRRAISISMPMPTTARCSATTCTHCRAESPALRSAPRRCSPPGMPRSMCRRSRITGSRKRQRTAAISPPRRGAARARRALVLRRILRDLAPAGLIPSTRHARRVLDQAARFHVEPP